MGELDSQFKLEPIIIDSPAETDIEIIEVIANALVDKGYVKKSYIQAVKDREASFPTGLNIGNEANVAIPHADIEHVIRPAIAFARLKKPVLFHNIENFEETVSVSLVFMLAVKDPEKQVDTLQKLMSIFEREDVLQGLLQGSTKKEIKEILEAIINE